MLCERGGISYQDTWKLLRDAGVREPEQELSRAAWTTLLGQAHATAEKQPEQAAAHQDTLWEAARHPSARVSAPTMQFGGLNLSPFCVRWPCASASVNLQIPPAQFHCHPAEPLLRMHIDVHHG